MVVAARANTPGGLLALRPAIAWGGDAPGAAVVGGSNSRCCGGVSCRELGCDVLRDAADAAETAETEMSRLPPRRALPPRFSPPLEGPAPPPPPVPVEASSWAARLMISPTASAWSAEGRRDEGTEPSRE